MPAAAAKEPESTVSPRTTRSSSTPKRKARPTRKRRKRPKKPKFTARNADKHLLYQMSVQEPEVEVSFINRAYRRLRKKKPLSMREDFCGTAYLCATWVKSSPDRTAVGVDLDRSVLDWGIEHNLKPLDEPGKRIVLRQQDVRKGTREKFDVINALNFSYWIFKTREQMADYFRRVRRDLNRDGILILDAYGGWESQESMYEERSIKRGGFVYVWDQHTFNPIDHSVTNYIHFEFRDKSKLSKAFTYEWRFWTLPELQELLKEAGFADVQVYWDRTTSEDEEDYRPAKVADNQPGWLAYLVAAN